MPSQLAPWAIYRQYVCPLRSRPLVGLIQHRTLSPLKYGDALWSIPFVHRRRKPSLISIVGSLVLSTATGGSDQAMSATLDEEGSTFYSLRGLN